MKRILKKTLIGLSIIITLIIVILLYTTIMTTRHNVKIYKQVYNGDLKYFKSGHIIVNVKINGSNKTYPFILDNGAKTTVFDNLLNDFEFTTIAYMPSRDVNKKITINPVFRIDTFVINNSIIVTDVAANLHSSKIFKCDNNIYGIIGNDIMKNLVWQFDFPKNKYYVSSNINKLKFKNDTFSTEFNGKGKISMIINNSVNKVLIDLGSTSSLKYKVRVKNNDKFYKNKWLKIYGNTGFGINGYNNSIKTSQVFIDSITIGANKLFNIDGVIAEKTANIIGLDFLKNFIVTFNFPDNKIIFAINKEQVFRKKHFGFKPIIKDSLLQIGTLYENSILYEDNIRVGDEIIQINSIKIDKNFDLCNFDASKYDTLNISIKVFDQVKKYKVIRDYYFK